MKKKILLISLALLLAIGLVATSCAAPAPEITTLNYLTSKEGTATHRFGFELSRLLEEYHPWLRVVAMDSPGSTYNTEVMAIEPERWPNTILLSGLYVTSRFLEEDPVKNKALEDLREITSYNASGPKFFQTFDPDIRTFQDMVGKKVAIGTKSSTTWGIMTAEQLKSWGIFDKINLQWLGPKAAGTALIDGAVDVSVSGVYASAGDKPAAMPSPILNNALATGRTLYYIAPTEEEVKKMLVGKTGWQVVSLPAGSIQFQEQDIYGFGLPGNIVAHKSLPEEAVYELVNFFFEYYKEFHPAHELFKLLNPTVMGFGSGLPYHPGAMKAYEEYAKAYPDSEAVRYWKKWGTIK